MNDLFKIIIGAIIAILVIGCAVMIFSQPSGDITTDANQTVYTTDDQVSQTPGESVAQDNATAATNTTATDNTQQQATNDGSSVAGGEVGQNAQEGSGEYYQINYKDGNMRQYDTKTGELIGSTFDEDQEKLGVVNGSLE